MSKHVKGRHRIVAGSSLCSSVVGLTEIPVASYDVPGCPTAAVTVAASTPSSPWNRLFKTAQLCSDSTGLAWRALVVERTRAFTFRDIKRTGKGVPPPVLTAHMSASSASYRPTASSPSKARFVFDRVERATNERRGSF